MVFEEQFPSLKNKGMRFELHIHKNRDNFPGCVREHYFWDKTKTGNAFAASEIEKHCLDKQKVKEAIKEVYTHEGSTLFNWDIRLMKKLGLVEGELR